MEFESFRPIKIRHRFLELVKRFVKSRTQRFTLTPSPNLFHRVGFRKTGRKPTHAHHRAVRPQVRRHFLAFLMIRRAIQKQNHQRVFGAQLLQVLQKIILVPIPFQTEKLGSVVCQSAKTHGSPVRARRQHDGLRASDNPSFLDAHVVDENALVFDYDAPRLSDACQVGRVFFKNSLRSRSFECA